MFRKSGTKSIRSTGGAFGVLAESVVCVCIFFLCCSKTRPRPLTADSLPGAHFNDTLIAWRECFWSVFLLVKFSYKKVSHFFFYFLPSYAFMYNNFKRDSNSLLLSLVVRVLRRNDFVWCYRLTTRFNIRISNHSKSRSIDAVSTKASPYCCHSSAEEIVSRNVIINFCRLLRADGLFIRNHTTINWSSIQCSSPHKTRESSLPMRTDQKTNCPNRRRRRGLKTYHIKNTVRLQSAAIQRN